MTSRVPLVTLAVVIVAQAALLWRPMREDSATVDEPVMLGAGYSYWHGHRCFLNVEHPPLAQLANALPVRCATSPTNITLLDAHPDYPYAARWDNLAVPTELVFPGEINFYYYPVLEAEEYGREFTFNAPDILWRGRIVPVLTVLATTVLVFAWASSLAGGFAGVIAAMAWAFNPVALAQGHLATTDAAAALFLPLALWTWARLTENPNGTRAAVAGLALGGALLAKFTATALVPTLLIVAWLEARRHREPTWQSGFVRGALLVVGTAWLLILLAYVPNWKPAPPISTELAEQLNVPRWFRWLRPVLIPPTFFKGLALVLTHTARGHESYLLGQWSNTGWWYYFPVAFALRTPLPLLALSVFALRSHNAASIGAAVYFLLAMTSNANLGIRHLLPVYALLAVASGTACRPRWIAAALAIWLAGVAVWAHPLYIQYFNELAGGATNGHRYLLDHDMGQDANRLKEFLGNRHVFISYHGRRGALAGIEYTPVTAAEARELRDAWLVISVTNLMRPEWEWLREHHSPEARVAATLFVYQMP